MSSAPSIFCKFATRVHWAGTGKGELTGFWRWYYYANNWPKYGLLYDDIIEYTKPEVVEALRRLPKDQLYQREFRISRAIHLSMLKDYLPKEEWTSPEKDVPYLTPFIEDVKKEMEQKQWWQKM